jgi:hypothetical protein
VRKQLDFHKIAIFGVGLFAYASVVSASDSLCAPNEQIFFNCPIRDSPKRLSVCGRAGEYLQYRFGSHDRPELVFPQMKDGSVDRFWVAREYVRSASYESHQLSFRSSGTEYRVYAISQQNEGPDSRSESYGGVIVSSGSGGDVTIPCGSAPDNGLDALVRKFGVEHREGQSLSDGVTRARFQLCQAMPFNSSDSDFKPGVAEYMLRPLNDASMLGLHDSPEVIELRDGADERLVAKPLHGILARDKKAPGQGVGWTYTPAPGFVGNDRAEFVVRGQAKAGDAVEFRLRYQLRVTPEKRSAYLAQPVPPLLSVSRTYCSMPTILLDFVGTP